MTSKIHDPITTPFWGFSQRKKVLITGIAFLAISAAIVGIIALMAAFPHTAAGLGIMNHAAQLIPFGATLLSVGCLTPICLVFWLYFGGKCAVKNGEADLHAAVLENNKKSSGYYKNFTDCCKSYNNFSSVLEQIQQELNIKDGSTHFNKLYPATFQIDFPLLLKDIPLDQNFKNQIKLLFLSKEQILSLSYAELMQSYQKSPILHMRLFIMENQMIRNNQKSQSNPIGEETLGKLRSLSTKDILKNSSIKITFFQFLTPAQKQQIFLTKEAPEAQDKLLTFDFIKILLPFSDYWTLMRTLHLLSSLKIEVFDEQSQHFSTLFRDILTQDVQFPHFFWKKIALSKNMTAAMFSLTSQEKERSIKILRSLEVEGILTDLIDPLSGSHLRHLSIEQFQSKHFPWKKIAQSEKKMKSMLSTKHIENTKKILSCLDGSAINIIVNSKFCSEDQKKLIEKIHSSKKDAT